MYFIFKSNFLKVKSQLNQDIEKKKKISSKVEK